jgi:hypothetical protein
MKKTTTVIGAAALATAATVILIATTNDQPALKAVENAPRPTVTATMTAPAKPAPTVTVTTTAKPTASVPQACLNALRDADAGFGYGASAMDAISDLLIDPDKALEQITTANRSLTALAPSYQANKAKCRAGGN